MSLFPSNYVDMQMDGEERRITMGVQAVVDADITEALMDALLEVTAKTAATWIAFLEASEQGIAEIRHGMAEVNAKIADDVSEAILDRYDATTLHTPAYRSSAKHPKNVRYTGVLRNILASRDFVQSDADGIYMGDIALLDQAAKQWARLNYGAGDRGSQGGGSTSTAHISDIDITISDSTGPRPGFDLPAGRWFGREFYPLSELPADTRHGPVDRHGRRTSAPITSSRPTRGIRGQHWTDAGLQVIVAQLGPAYLEMFNKLWNSASDQAKAAYSGTRTIQQFRRPKMSSASVVSEGNPNVDDPDI